MANGENKSGRPSKSGSKVFTEIFRKLVGEATQQEAAEKIGVTRQNVGRWLAGMNTPDIEALEKIADAYEVSTDYLLGRTNIQAMDLELRKFCEYTGLSDETVRNLHELSFPKHGVYSKENDSDFSRAKIIALNSFINAAYSYRFFLQAESYADGFIFLEEFQRCMLKKYCLENNIKASEKEIDDFFIIDDDTNVNYLKYQFYVKDQLNKYDMILPRTEILTNEGEYPLFRLEKDFNRIFDDFLDDFLQNASKNAFYSTRKKEYREYFENVFFSGREYTEQIEERIKNRASFEKMVEAYRKEKNDHADHNPTEE